MRDFTVPTSANYTEYLRDYIKNNTLPASLSDADEAFECDFTEVFTQYFLMREIGFDTEEMFSQKLNAQISVYLPYYINKANNLKMLFDNIFESGYTITQTNDLTNEIVSETSTDQRLDYETPIGSAEKELPASALSGGSENTNTRTGTSTNTGDITTVFSKNPRFNSVEALREFQENFKNIIYDCLKSFECLFMQIF